MAEQAWEDAREEGMRLSLLVFFFVLFLVIIVVNEFTVFGNLALFFLVVLFIQIIGDEVHVHGVRLRHLEFGLTLRTTQDLAFFDFIFVHIDFGGTFWTTNHGVILRRVVRKVAVAGRPPLLRSVLYTVEYEVNSRARCGCRERHCRITARTSRMVSSREYPERPVVGIGGVIIDGGRALLIRRGSEPLRGEWSIPGGTLELGETWSRASPASFLKKQALEFASLSSLRCLTGFMQRMAKSRSRHRTNRVFIMSLWTIFANVSPVSLAPGATSRT